MQGAVRSVIIWEGNLSGGKLVASQCHSPCSQAVAAENVAFAQGAADAAFAAPVQVFCGLYARP